MPTFLSQLENNEAILLMYLAGELSQEDRDEVEAMLSRDAGMRATLAELASLHDEVNVMMSAADAATALAGREMAIGRVMRALKRQSERETTPMSYAKSEPARALRIAWWVYPLAAAAMVLVAMILWSGNSPVKLGPERPPGGELVDATDQVLQQVVWEQPARPQDSLANLESDLAMLNPRNLEIPEFPRE